MLAPEPSRLSFLCSLSCPVYPLLYLNPLVLHTLSFQYLHVSRFLSLPYSLSLTVSIFLSPLLSPLGALGSVVGNPFDVLKTRMMTAEGNRDREKMISYSHIIGRFLFPILPSSSLIASLPSSLLSTFLSPLYLPLSSLPSSLFSLPPSPLPP
jgi:hypothetical protein